MGGCCMALRIHEAFHWAERPLQGAAQTRSLICWVQEGVPGIVSESSFLLQVKYFNIWGAFSLSVCEADASGSFAGKK